MRLLTNMADVTKMDRERNGVIQRRKGARTELACRVDRNVLKWFGLVMYRMSKGANTDADEGIDLYDPVTQNYG